MAALSPQKTPALSKHLRATDRGDWEGAGRQVAGKRPFSRQKVSRKSGSVPWTTRQGWSQPSRSHLAFSHCRKDLKAYPARSSINSDTQGLLGEGAGFETSFSHWPLKTKARIFWTREKNPLKQQRRLCTSKTTIFCVASLSKQTATQNHYLPYPF